MLNMSIFWLSVIYILIAEVLCLPFSILLAKLVDLDGNSAPVAAGKKVAPGEVLLKVDNLQQYFKLGKFENKAVDGVKRIEARLIMPVKVKGVCGCTYLCGLNVNDFLDIGCGFLAVISPEEIVHMIFNVGVDVPLKFAKKVVAQFVEGGVMTVTAVIDIARDTDIVHILHCRLHSFKIRKKL